MRDQHHESDGQSPSQLRHVEQLCNHFEDAWKNGQQPQIEDYLGSTPEPERAVLLRELLALELAYRRLAAQTTASDPIPPATPGAPAAVLLDFLEPPAEPGELG